MAASIPSILLDFLENPLLPITAKPIRPEPNSNKVADSGTGLL
jgi:hypothetical protein